MGTKIGMNDKLQPLTYTYFNSCDSQHSRKNYRLVLVIRKNYFMHLINYFLKLGKKEADAAFRISKSKVSRLKLTLVDETKINQLAQCLT